MPQVSYQGPSEDGRQYKFANNAGAVFQAYVRDSLKPMVDRMTVGQQLDAGVEQKTGKNGNTYTVLTSVNGQMGKREDSGGGGYGGGYKKGRGPYDPRQFVASVVNKAIEAGLIKSPADIAGWATESYKVVTTLGPAAVKAEIQATAQTLDANAIRQVQPNAIQSGDNIPPTEVPF